MAPKWQHNALARDLAVHLWAGGQRLTWVDFAPMGAGTARPDVFAMRRHAYSAPEIVSYEVKVSAADLRSDLSSGKWQKYLDFSGGVVLDPFAGTGTVGVVADILGRNAVLIEANPEYVETHIRRRLSALRGGDAGLFARGAG